MIGKCIRQIIAILINFIDFLACFTDRLKVLLSLKLQFPLSAFVCRNGCSDVTLHHLILFVGNPLLPGRFYHSKAIILPMANRLLQDALSFLDAVNCHFPFFDTSLHKCSVFASQVPTEGLFSSFVEPLFQ